MKSEAMVVLCTFPDFEKARQIGAVLVERQVAACINILPGATSIYRWEGKIEEESEVLGVIKTTTEAYPALEAAILKLHPYDTPEVLALPVQMGAEKYLAWVAGEVGENP
ncbi:divalent-cation tolerance protein CutA [Haloferula sp.]|uniref:divalent-cation tolerance protein CutA n=1 Tax=Haloferula sp. TaxID=2497595 RepID=UPI00329E288E